MNILAQFNTRKTGSVFYCRMSIPEAVEEARKQIRYNLSLSRRRHRADKRRPRIQFHARTPSTALKD